jgi:thiol-disulfide isomerase/thioredoxin
MEYQYRSQRSQLLEAAVEGVIQDRLLTEAAAARGVSLEEIVAAETEGKVEVSDAEVEDWYRRNSSRLQGRQLDDVAPQIRQYLEDIARQQLVTALVSGLGSEHEIEYFVEPARADFELEGAPSFGPEDAPVTLIEFSDFECPFCSRFFPTINRIKEEYGERVRIVYLQFPLTNIHPNAFKAAEASLCAHEQGSFWEMHGASGRCTTCCSRSRVRWRCRISRRRRSGWGSTRRSSAPASTPVGRPIKSGET